LIKYIKSVLWRVAKRLSYIEDTRCLKVKIASGTRDFSSTKEFRLPLGHVFPGGKTVRPEAEFSPLPTADVKKNIELSIRLKGVDKKKYLSIFFFQLSAHNLVVRANNKIIYRRRIKLSG
jgi:hypothetical protein